MIIVKVKLNNYSSYHYYTYYNLKVKVLTVIRSVHISHPQLKPTTTNNNHNTRLHISDLRLINLLIKLII